MVYSFVAERNGLMLLKDKRVLLATADVSGISMNETEVWTGSACRVDSTWFHEFLYQTHCLLRWVKP